MNPSGALRQQIEDMALQLVVGEPETSLNASVWVPVLEKISAAAVSEHAESVAGAATSFGLALRALAECSTADPLTVSNVLQEGVASLQNALVAPARESAPAGEVASLGSGADVGLCRRKPRTPGPDRVPSPDSGARAHGLRGLTRGFPGLPHHQGTCRLHGTVGGPETGARSGNRPRSCSQFGNGPSTPRASMSFWKARTTCAAG